MKSLNLKDVSQYVEQNIGTFHNQRIRVLDGLKLKDVIKRKNPYLFRAKNVQTTEQIITGIIDAYISSSEEGIFGDWLEGLAIFINGKVYGGSKSSANGIDLEFEKDNIRYIVSIKSGPNWGNKSQKEKMLLDFNDAKKSLNTSGSRLQVICVNGCCYGQDRKPHKFPKKGTDYYKYCGQEFWEFISGDENLYTEIIEPLGHKAKEKNDEFMTSYSQVVNKFTRDFANDFCLPSGAIDWNKLVCFNSGKK